MTLRDRLVRKAGAVTSRVVLGKPAETDEKMAATTIVWKGGVQAVVSVSTILGVIGFLRAFMPAWLPWPPELDKEVAGSVGGLIAGVAWAVGMVRNVLKNRSLLQNGLTMTRKA